MFGGLVSDLNQLIFALYRIIIFLTWGSVTICLQMGELAPEKSIPDAVLNGARGLAILTVFKMGLMLTYKVGTGLVVARNRDGTWSAPSAIASCGLGWGAQVGISS